MNSIWLFSRRIDLLVLLLPVWISWMICFGLPEQMLQHELPVWAWVVLVIGIDVSHVWSTLFRTYLDKDELSNHSRILKLAPVASFLICFIVASFSTQLFWSLLAYLALYHFIKQQYGFMQLYRIRYGEKRSKKRISDAFMIYVAMLYPVVYWHLNYDRAFEWFVPGDFLDLSFESLESILPVFNSVGNFMYFTLLMVWFVEDFKLSSQAGQKRPWGKWFWVVTTAFNWFLGIVYFNSDVAFTLTNVVAHGIPYLVLVLIYIKEKNKVSSGNRWSGYGLKYSFFVIVVVLILAMTEEYFWDMLMYGDNASFFEIFMVYPFELLQSPMAQAVALAMLSLPQVTHYILDGFIWKSNAHNPFLKKALFNK